MSRLLRRRLGRTTVAGVVIAGLTAAVVTAPGLLLHPVRAASASRPVPRAACPWVASHASPDVRAAMVQARMTVRDKVVLLGLRGGVGGYENSTPPIPRLCFPRLTLQDGPAGITGRVGATQLPAPVALAATWNIQLAGRYGAVIGTEAHGRGIDVAQGPTINIARVPQAGRTWEAFGEDPYLTAAMAVADIRGIQRQGVMANVKHFAANNQETHRLTIDEQIAERTLHEIYLPAFHAAITRAHAASVMCAYNQINHHYGCANGGLLTGMLRHDWGFRGFIRSDLGAVHNVAASYAAGMDQARNAAPIRLAAAISNDGFSDAALRGAVHHVLREMFTYGLFNHRPGGNPLAVVTSPAHAHLGLAVAEAGTVLLKNTGLLPLIPAHLHSLAVIGRDAGRWAHTAGDGSAHVRPPYVISPVAGIRARVGSRVTVRSVPIWHGNAAHPNRTLTAAALRGAVRAARAADVAVVFANDVEREGADRHSLSLPYGQNRLIAAVAAANPRTVVVLNTGGPVLMPWLPRVAGVLEAWYPGQQDGRAAAAVLFGDVNPSGKLPLTFPANGHATPTSAPARWPGIGGVAHYSEGLFVGYRWYAAHHVRPLFPFGYGLSYTTFQLSGLTVEQHGSTRNRTVTVGFTVTNTGRRAGAATPQLYIGYPAALGEPPRQLKAFASVRLTPGEAQHVHFTLPITDFGYWNTVTHAWTVAPGGYRIFAGTSSIDLPLATTISLPDQPAGSPTSPA